MAELTDEERAKLVLGEDVEEETPAEPITETETPPEPEDEPIVEAETEEKPLEEAPTDESFTKQFPNLKGETLVDYNRELETAYDNSFKESLRLVEENKQLKAQLAQLPQPGVQQQPLAPALDPVTASIIEDVKADRTRSMMSAFDEFKKDYPQALETDNFNAFTKASDGVNMALTATLGYKPSWQQLFKGVAGSLGWQPTVNDDKKNNIIKENASSGRSSSSQAPLPPKAPKVPEASIIAYQKMFTSKTREEAIKDLSEVV